MPRYNIIAASLLVLVLIFALSSCGAVAGLAMKADRSATLALSIEVPAAVDTRIRAFASTGGAAAASTVPLFDAAAVTGTLVARGMTVRESVVPSPRSYRGAYTIKGLSGILASDPGLAGVFAYSQGDGWASLRIRIHRDNAATLTGLFPGIDRDLLEALQPPALYDNPVTAEEYRSMLSGLLGKTAASAIDGLVFKLNLDLPGTVLESGGGVVIDASGRKAIFTVSALDAMVLEKPIDFLVKWKE